MGGKAEVDGFHGGKTERWKKKVAKRRMPPMQSSVRERAPAGATLSCATDKPSIVALEREKKTARQRNSRAGQRAFSCSLRQTDKRFFFFFFTRLFVFSFSIGMSTAQTRGTPATYVRRDVAVEGVGVGGQKVGYGESSVF